METLKGLGCIAGLFAFAAFGHLFVGAAILWFLVLGLCLTPLFVVELARSMWARFVVYSDAQYEVQRQREIRRARGGY